MWQKVFFSIELLTQTFSLGARAFCLPKLAATKLSPAELPALLDKSSLPRRDCQQRRGFNKIAKCEKTG
jgi:hypothetical protein